MFIYFFTNTHINLSGIYQLTDRVIALETNSTMEEVKAYKELFELANKVLFYKEWVCVVNAVRYGGYEGPKLKTPFTKEVNSVPNDVKDYFLDRVSIPYVYPMDTPINHKSEIINNKSEIINHKSEGVDVEKGMTTIKNIFRERGLLK